MSSIDDEIQELVEAAYFHGLGVENLDTGESEPPRDIADVQWITNRVKQLITDARIEAVQELKSRWNDDRKTMDYSPATYQFICDKYIKELKEKR